MKHFQRFLSVSAVCLTLFSACKKEFKTQVSTPLQDLARPENLAATAGNSSGSEQPDIPNVFLQNNSFIESYGGLIGEPLGAVASMPCNQLTPLRVWMEQQRADWPQTLRTAVAGLGMRFIAADYSFFFENSSENQSFGPGGEYNQIMAKTFKDLKRFWEMQNRGIVLVALHGSTLASKEKVRQTLIANFDLSFDAAEKRATDITQLLADNPALRNGNHPYFSFNAFAVRQLDFTADGLGVLPYKIMMGDGLLQGFAAIGFNDVAPQAILAHEMGHQIQYLYNLYPENPRTPESNRKAELMADAFSSYFLSHARGATMQWKRVKQFLQVFFNNGDCQFNDPNHHGTPTQRMAAAEWAYRLADDAQKQGKILSVAEFVALFEAQLPALLLQ